MYVFLLAFFVELAVVDTIHFFTIYLIKDGFGDLSNDTSIYYYRIETWGFVQLLW